ncbi:Alpha/Beta hydrolase protein [Aspergillus crustosus]
MPSLRNGLYTTFTLVTAPLRLLSTCFYYLLPFTRPSPRWTYHQAVGIALANAWFDYATAVRYHRKYYQGILLRNLATEPLPVGAIWYPTATSSTRPTQAILHFHGGAYVLGGVRLNEDSWGPQTLSQVLNVPVLSVQYRLSTSAPTASSQSVCFPAALQDAVTAYAYLLETMHLQPNKIILSGDSAGGNLVLALIRYLNSSSTPRLSLPKAALLWSPWLDLSPSATARTDRHRNRKTDFVSSALLEWGASYCTAPGMQRTQGTGTAEVMVDEHRLFVARMRELGNRVIGCEVEGATHDIFPRVGNWAGCPRRRGAMMAAGDFLDTIG